MKRKVIILTLLCSILLIACLFYIDDIRHHGHVFANRQKLCTFMAQSYLRTIHEKERVADLDPRWDKAIQIETEIYNLCLSDLK